MSDKSKSTTKSVKIDKKNADTQTDDQQKNQTNKLNNLINGHDVSVDTSLVCTIPEHHRLEDIIHLNREEIANLKFHLKQLEVVNNNAKVNEDLYLMDKRAEFEALDLAINTRRKQLVDLELLKNRKLNEDSMLSDENSVSYLQVITRFKT
jgi:hypothetical protein